MKLDLIAIGDFIRSLRMKAGLTQAELAERLNVSFQAVSNWERGNSMPDISKLEQLCSVLHITVNELLGMEETAAAVPTLDVREMTVAELKDAAPALPPAEVKARVKVEKKKRKLDLDSIIAVAPFLDEDTLDEVLADAKLDDIEDLVGLAPFLHKDTLNKLLEQCEVDDMDDLVGLAPFLSKEVLEKHVERIIMEDPDALEELNAIAPFLPRGSLARIVKNLM